MKDKTYNFITKSLRKYTAGRPGIARLNACLVLAILLVSTLPAVGEGKPAALTSEQERNLATYFGFGELEVFKIEHGITQLRTADFNNDGLLDMVVANNSKSTVEVLLQRDKAPAEPEQPAEVNDLVNHWRFEKKSVSVTWRVSCLKVADLTGDGNVDIVLFGEPKELVVLPGKGDGTFEQAIVRRVRDGIGIPRSFDIGDVNGDGREDVALLAASDVLFFYQRENGGLAEPKRMSHALENVSALELADLDGDGRVDLVLLTQDEEFPLMAQYQDELGNLGPVQRMKLPGLRSIYFARGCNEKSEDLFGVERVSGRLKRWTFDRSAVAGKDDEWAVLYYPLPGKAESSQRPLTVGDVDGDGLSDLVGADVDGAQLILFRQKKGLGLMPADLFGGQVKTRDMCSFAVDGDSAQEVFVLSSEEGFIARSVFKDNRLTFPKAVPTIGKPFAMDVAVLKEEADPIIAYISRNEDDDYQLIIQPLSATATDNERISKIAIEDLDEPPAALRVVDVNRDGLSDILVFTPYAPLDAFMQQKDGSFSLLGKDGSCQKGLVKQAQISGFAYADADGDGKREVLLAQGNFVRALCVNEAGSWEILDQYNPPSSDVEIQGVAVVPMKGSNRPFLAMYDNRGREIILFKPSDGGTFKLDHTVRVGKFDLKMMLAAPLAGMEQPSILLADARRVALVLPNVPASKARERGVYESSIKDARLMKIASGDVNHDGRADLVVIDAKDHFVEILTFGPDESLVRGNKFRVFAKKQYHGRNSGAPEPSWVEIADLTNDGKDDLILIAHDRILLYPGQ